MRLLVVAAVAALLSGCATPEVIKWGDPAESAVARGETEPVGTAAADAADDPAIWRNAANPAASLIVATDKKAGLYVYGLDGKVRHFAGGGLLNNVDLIDLGAGGIMVVASDRNDPLKAKLRLYRLDTAAAKLVELGTVDGGDGEAYGVCLAPAPDGAFDAFSAVKDGTINQVRITPGATPSGRIIRTMKLATQIEGCVIDRRSSTLYVGEEDVGIWKFDARAEGPVAGTLVLPADGKSLVADVEGLALAPEGADGGYLVASSQGDNAYVLFRLPDLAVVGRVRIIAGKFGSTEETDGIDLVLGDFGPDYPGGLFVVQDGANAPHAQNFKLVAWDDVLRAARASKKR